MTGVHVTISQKTLARLQKHAVPLVSTVDTVINQALDALEGVGSAIAGNSSSIIEIDGAAPPNLAHTTVLAIELGGETLPKSETYWNSLLKMLIIEASRTYKPETLQKKILANCVVGNKNDNGYKYIDEAGISLQGADANVAWRAAYRLLSILKIPVKVQFRWQDNPKAAHPATYGSITVQP